MKKLLQLLALTMIMAGCEKDQKEVISYANTKNINSAERTFCLLFQTSGNNVYADYPEGASHESSDEYPYYYDDSLIFISFYTNSMDVIPEIKVNGKQMDAILQDGIYAYGWISYAPSIDYSISANGAVTSGTISMPGNISQFTCNGTVVNSWDWSTYLDRTSTYQLVWSGSNTSYYKLYLSISGTINNQYYYESLDTLLTSSSLTYTEKNTSPSTPIEPGVTDCSDYSGLSVNLIPNNGSLIKPNATPDVKGSYGNGFVVASNNSNNYYIYLNPATKCSGVMKNSTQPNSSELFEEMKALIKRE